jgi:Cof subfamily protein (haloacid dehalogenase superfamily)
MKAKAIIFDVDGTAIDSPEKKLPSKELVNTIKKISRTYYLCAATGRVWSFAKPVLRALKLVDPCIISAGTQICDPKSGKIYWQKTIEPGDLSKIIEIFKTNPDYKLLYNDGTEDDYFNGGVLPEQFETDEPIYFLEQVFIPDDIAIKLNEKLDKVGGITSVMVVSQKPGCRDIHIVNKEAIKEQAVARLLKTIGVDKQNTIGIGDGHNDLHLFSAVHYKVAMGNAVKELKEAADIIIGNVRDDGMYDYLQSLILQL